MEQRCQELGTKPRQQPLCCPGPGVFPTLSLSFLQECSPEPQGRGKRDSEGAIRVWRGEMTPGHHKVLQ